MLGTKSERAGRYQPATFKGLILLLALLVASAGDAHAYLDPGTGSILLQALIGTLAAGAAFFATFKARLRDLFRSRKSKEANDSPASRT
jgi:hypothetical protein